MSVVGCSTATKVRSRELKTTTPATTTTSNAVATRWPTTQSTTTTPKTLRAVPIIISSTSITATQFYIVARRRQPQRKHRHDERTKPLVLLVLLGTNRNSALDTTVCQPINVLGIDAEKAAEKDAANKVFTPLIDNYYISKNGQQVSVSVVIVATPKTPTAIKTLNSASQASNYCNGIESNQPPPTNHPPFLSSNLLRSIRSRRHSTSVLAKHKKSESKSKQQHHNTSAYANNYYVALLLLYVTTSLSTSFTISDNQSVQGMLSWCSTTLMLNANPCEAIAHSQTITACLHDGPTTVSVVNTQHLLTMLLNRNQQFVGAWLRHSSCLPTTLVVIALILMFSCVPVISASSSSSSSSSSASSSSSPSSSSSSPSSPSSSSSSFANVKYSRHTVKTKYGPLRGIMVRANPPVEAYLGVPYATPPVGSLR